MVVEALRNIIVMSSSFIIFHYIKYKCKMHIYCKYIQYCRYIMYKYCDDKCCRFILVGHVTLRMPSQLVVIRRLICGLRGTVLATKHKLSTHSSKQTTQNYFTCILCCKEASEYICVGSLFSCKLFPQRGLVLNLSPGPLAHQGSSLRQKREPGRI